MLTALSGLCLYMPTRASESEFDLHRSEEIDNKSGAEGVGEDAKELAAIFKAECDARQRAVAEESGQVGQGGTRGGASRGSNRQHVCSAEEHAPSGEAEERRRDGQPKHTHHGWKGGRME